MPIAKQAIGQGSDSATGSFITLSSAISIQAGDLVFVSVAHRTTSTDIVLSVTDGVNTYTRIDAVFGGSGFGGLYTYYCKNAQAVVAPTIQASFNTNVVDRWIAAVRVSGVSSVDPLDQHASAALTTATASPSIATGVLSEQPEIVLGVILVNTNPAFTEGSGFDQDEHTVIGTAVTYNLADQIVFSTNSVTYNPTLGAARACLIAVATFLTDNVSFAGTGSLSANLRTFIFDLLERMSGSGSLFASARLIERTNVRFAGSGGLIASPSFIPASATFLNGIGSLRANLLRVIYDLFERMGGVGGLVVDTNLKRSANSRMNGFGNLQTFANAAFSLNGLFQGNGTMRANIVVRLGPRGPTDNIVVDGPGEASNTVVPGPGETDNIIQPGPGPVNNVVA